MVGRRPHPTYTDRATPRLQSQAQASKLDDSTQAGRSQRDAMAPAPAVVPVTRDTYYDPSHPQADWGGFVSKKHMQKGHAYDHRSQQIGIESTEHGIVSKEEKQEFAHRRQADENIVTTSKATYKMGGVANNDFERWKTTYNAFDHQDPTSKDQMILVKRQGTKRVVNDPASSKPGVRYDPNQSMRSVGGSVGGGSYEQEQQMVGSTSTSAHRPPAPRPGRGGSMIANIGASLVDRIDGDMPKSIVTNEMDPRSMLYSNYKPLPGYTGKKNY
jgi:hypothetical protein